MKELWFLRNECIFGNVKCDLNVTKKKIKQLLLDNELRLTANMWNKQYGLQVLKIFGLKIRGVKSMNIKEVFFQLPEQGKLLLCCDGSSRGNPGGLGVSTNYYAEIFAVLIAGEWALIHGFNKLVFKTDSKVFISDFQGNTLPWFAITRWERICEASISWEFTHSYREVNFSADTMAKRGSVLCRGEQSIYGQKPDFLGCLEDPNQVYFTFF
ncbi:uncharacterized protein LOC113347927 [Papaver somniferum]|uniref:uncharacterized protein LOC113347927 n=1 Tax=Papaver somniferum TaxID=3469 RepID=UPI000E6FE882|nr:uncharacterized protein LOC113347927 [Papaver somniferum]